MSVNVPFHVGLFLAEVHMQLSVFSPDGSGKKFPPVLASPPPQESCSLLSPQSNLKCRSGQIQIYAFELLFLDFPFVGDGGGGRRDAL